MQLNKNSVVQNKESNEKQKQVEQNKEGLFSFHLPFPPPPSQPSQNDKQVTQKDSHPYKQFLDHKILSCRTAASISHGHLQAEPLKYLDMQFDHEVQASNPSNCLHGQIIEFMRKFRPSRSKKDNWQLCVALAITFCRSSSVSC